MTDSTRDFLFHYGATSLAIATGMYAGAWFANWRRRRARRRFYSDAPPLTTGGRDRFARHTPPCSPPRER